MYSPGDAVAKIDGYIISIAAASPHVGEKRMVRIEQVGRTAASALLLDEHGEVVRGGGAPSSRTAAPAPRRDRSKTGQRKPRSAPKPKPAPAAGARLAPIESPAGMEPLDSPALAAPVGDASSNGASGRSEPPSVLAEEDGVQSKPRRRGRRGGRRRSAAKAETTSE
jgi:hypothetical protein